MTTNRILSVLILGSLCLVGCGGGSSAENELVNDPMLINDPVNQPVEGPRQGTGPVESDITAEPGDIAIPNVQAVYKVTLENFWGADEYPQGFPDDAHLSLIGGATHNAAVSFWEPGEVASRGIEDMAETGRIDELLFDEVAPAIINSTADSMIEIREYTDAQINGVAGVKTFELVMNIEWPLVSLVTMLGPSPDWFVGVSGLSLLVDDEWATTLSVDLPLYDGGTKSDVTPTMGGPDIIPANPIALITYDEATGVYLPTNEPQNIARLTFERLDIK